MYSYVKVIRHVGFYWFALFSPVIANEIHQTSILHKAVTRIWEKTTVFRLKSDKYLHQNKETYQR